MSFASLVRLMPPPEEPIEADGSWSHAEGRLGTTLPDDFKEFIQSYGSGTINHFLTILNPFSKRTTLNLMDQSINQIDALRKLHDDFGEPNPFQLFPARGGILPVGITDNGDVIHWLTAENPSQWTMVVNESRSPDYQEFSCNLTVFLSGLLDGSIKCRAFPTSFGDHSGFTPA